MTSQAPSLADGFGPGGIDRVAYFIRLAVNPAGFETVFYECSAPPSAFAGVEPRARQAGRGVGLLAMTGA